MVGINDLRSGPGKVFVEGEFGQEIVRELPAEKVNPYARAGKKDRFSSQRRQIRKKTAPDSKGYLWTMGYNTCVGSYSGGRQYDLFTGSSLNRSLKIKTDDEKLCAATNHLYKVANQVAAKMSGIFGWEVSRQIRDFINGPNIESAGRFAMWVQSEILHESQPVSYNVHVLSSRSRGKVKDKATAFFRACPGSRIFVTLSFVAAVDDQTGISILNKFLTSIRKTHKDFQFLWIAERQEKNLKFPGNIHFHIIMNKRLPVKRYNALWVLQQYNAGLRAHNKYDEAITMQEVLDRYRDGTMQKILNPFDVRKVKSIGGLSAYLTKYITKQEKNTPFNCANWHCSRGVSRLFTRTVVSPSAFRYCLSLNNCKVDKDTGEVFEAKYIKKPFFIMAYINNKSLPLGYLKEMEQINKWLVQGMIPDKLRSCNDELYSKYFLCEN
jgi:hypothetical protein